MNELMRTIIRPSGYTLILLYHLVNIVTCQNSGYYTIVAPKVLRPNSDYHVSISVEATIEPTTVVVEVGGRQDSGGAYKSTQYVTVDRSSTRIVRLEISDIGSGIYNLTVQGTKGLYFRNSTLLEYLHKSYSVFIQTDKAIYKPGHKVLFRTIVLSPSLRPVTTRFLDIYITDGKGNRVKEWKKQLTTQGVFSSELQLSESPVLGDWNITVNILDQIFHKTFQVAEYVLPKFEVTANVPKHATFKDSKIVATIYAKYTYGRAVKGEATITANPGILSGVIQTYYNPVWKVVPIDGKATVEFDINSELKLKDDYERPIYFEVTVEEALTGRRQNISASTLLHRHKYKMEFIKTAEYFKPGLKCTAFIKITHHDGSPVSDTTNYVKVKQFYSYNDDEFMESKHKLNREGLIQLTYYPPSKNVTIIRIEAEYLDVKEWFPSISASVSPSNTFIQATLKTENPVANSDIEVVINCTEPLRYVNYQVFGRGDIITANTMTIPNSHTTVIRFLATSNMAPAAYFIVYYVKENGELIADSLDIDVKGVLQNHVTAKVNKDQVEPGGDVELTMEAKPNSYIGLLGIDQSVLLLKNTNDINHETVLNELRSYDVGDTGQMSPFSRTFRDDDTPQRYSGSYTAQEAFTKSGAVILSNGYIHEHIPWVYYRANMLDDYDRPEGTTPQQNNEITNQVTSKIRQQFPETWLWDVLETGIDGKISMKRNVPDSITSWVISAFSVDNVYGLGLMDAPHKLKVFKQFFISLDLPYSVIRGEVVAIPVVIFSYLNKDTVADVTLENIGQFEFADYSNELDDPPKLDLYRRKKVNVKSNSGATTTFLVKAVELGYISIRITANSPLAGDAIEHKLLVKPEGETIYKNQAMFVDLRKLSSFDKNATLDIPINVVPGSEHIEVSVVGDIMGPSIPHLTNLIKMPFGCGEQNMLNFVPNIVALDYLKNSHQLTQSVEGKALRHMETGYQQELTYRRQDGSFSAFGSSDPNGSTWLTAFVTKSFRQAASYIAVEEQIILDALQWLANNQAANGSFPEVGKVSHTDMQGGSAKGLALTAYSLIAFLENQRATSVYRNVVNKAVEYIVKNIPNIDDPYALAISTYALHLSYHPAKDTAFNLLEAQAKTVGDMKFWKRKEKDDDKNPWNKVPNSVDIEMTSYALLSYIQRGLYEDSLPILYWLISQQNDQGGFASTQDTVIGLYALSKLAEGISSTNINMNILVTTSTNFTSNFKLDSGNSMVLQKHELGRKTREATIEANGSGFAIIQISYRYNVNVTGEWPLFILDPQVDKNSDANHLQLTVCTSFVGGNNSNMAVMEIALPSGYTADIDALPSLQASYKVKRIETKNADTLVILYFDEITKEEICPTVSAFRTQRVANQKPVAVTEYDYYDQTRRARVFYDVRAATLCDICEGMDCEKVCSGKPGSQAGNKDVSGTCFVRLNVFILMASLVFTSAITALL